MTTLVQVWCGAHQFDLGMGEILSIVVKYHFYSVMTGFISYLGRQVKIISDMDTICSRFFNSWLSTYKVTK